MDFLRHYGLIVDTVKQCLRNATSPGGEGKKKTQNPDAMVLLLSKILTLTLNQSLTVRLSRACLSPPPLKSFCTSTHACLNYTRPHRHKTQHYIETTGPPVFSRVRRLSPEKMANCWSSGYLSSLTASILARFIWFRKRTVSTESPEISVFLTSRLKLTDTLPFSDGLCRPHGRECCIL